MLAEPSPAPEPMPLEPAASAVPSKKRKRERGPAAPAVPTGSPAPPDAAIGAADVISSRADLSKRPQLSISRGPHFIPLTEGSDFYKTELIGVNHLGYRYVPAGINPPGHAQPCRTIESNPTAYRVSWEDRSSFIGVSKDGLRLCGGKGFRSARCNAPVREGKWYMEIKIINGGGDKVSGSSKQEGSHVRLGWGRREAPLNGPVGLDGYSYGIRDKTGEKVTLSRPKPYGKPFKSGDVVGMYISLPPSRVPSKSDPNDPAHLKRERIAIDLKGQEFFEILEYPQSKEMTSLLEYTGKTTNSSSLPSSSKKAAAGKLPSKNPSRPVKKEQQLRPLPTLPESHIAFFVNGECQGTAFSELYDYLQLRSNEVSRKKEKRRLRGGVKEHKENPFDDGSLGYYPFISLFNDASVELNPGPTFEYPPPPDIEALLRSSEKMDLDPSSQQTWRPTCERYPEFMEEQWELDRVEEEEARAEAIANQAREKAEEEKKAAREKRRAQDEARRKAKREAEMAAVASDAVKSEPSSQPLHTGILSQSPVPQPSPLRQTSVFVDTTYSSSGPADAPTSTLEQQVKKEDQPDDDEIANMLVDAVSEKLDNVKSEGM